ncbi:hypothetical protein FSP39_002401 [Pinctada imbricata]|uniref:Uncharacterized protein n=1 Tax=Pinctada imbricata TaxID=66713 RepID=A0AA88XRB5_PINIB|nr:hypothetical protein FSP39_002401 [Pinctada imbricata]
MSYFIRNLPQNAVKRKNATISSSRKPNFASTNKTNNGRPVSVTSSPFWDDGYFVLENFITEEEADVLLSECKKIVDDMNPEEHNTVFTTLEMKRTSDDYFMTSGDKIRFFFEDGAKDEKGNLKVDKQKSLNKIGHALHILNPVFRKATFDDKIKNVAKSLQLANPVVCQSMVIFKQPGIGGEVVPHQDATFLYTDPMKLFGYWIALEDATMENGCLWFIPGSHKSGLYGNRRMIRNPDDAEGQPRTVFTNPVYEYNDSQFIPLPVKRGSLVLIHGEVVHKSLHNKSPKSRIIYTFHTFDQQNTEYSDKNWLQPSKEVPFTPLYSTAAQVET